MIQPVSDRFLDVLEHVMFQGLGTGRRGTIPRAAAAHRPPDDSTRA